jgi:glycosyltransferase involved in cell wall biosynthesis
MKASPFVSIIIPNYNHASFLRQRIDSVLYQTYQNYELIILDDCSTDNSTEIIEEYRNHPKVSHIVYNIENSGSTFIQWNKGVDLAQSEYIWIAESDDVAERAFLETLMPKIIENNIVIAYCQSNRLSADNEVTGTWLTQTQLYFNTDIFQHNFTYKGLQFIQDFLLRKNVIPNASGVIFKKSVYNTAGKAKETVKTNGDHILWTSMLTYGDIYFCATALNNFRDHSNSVIAKSTSCSFSEVRYSSLLLFHSLKKNLKGLNDIEKRKLLQNIKREQSESVLRFCYQYYYSTTLSYKVCICFWYIVRYAALGTYLKQKFRKHHFQNSRTRHLI